MWTASELRLVEIEINIVARLEMRIDRDARYFIDDWNSSIWQMSSPSIDQVT